MRKMILMAVAGFVWRKLAANRGARTAKAATTATTATTAREV
jgi:hypothetical protein